MIHPKVNDSCICGYHEAKYSTDNVFGAWLMICKNVPAGPMYYPNKTPIEKKKPTKR